MKKETLEQIFKISMAMTLINEHQILSAKNVCVSEKSSIVALIFKRLIPDGQIFNTTNKQYIPISFFKFNNTNMVLHPELGIIDLDLAITKSIQPLNPLKLNSTILHNKIVDEIANKTPNFTMRIKNWLHNDPSRGDYAVDTLKKIISQYNLLNAYKQNSYYKSICNSTDIDINDKDYFQDFENRLKTGEMSAYTKQKFSNGKLALETEFKCDSTSHITHHHFILSNEHFFVSDNNKFPRTSQFIHQTKWIDFSSNDFIHPEHYGSADLFLDAYQDNRIYKDDLSFLVKSLFDVCLAPSLDKLLTVTNLDSIDYSGLLVGKFGLNIDLGVDYLIKTSKVDEADNDCVLFRKLFSIINQFENKIDHNNLIDAFDKRNINLLNLYSTHSNETEKDQFKHNSFFETMMARYTENILNDIINESVLDSASQNANQDKTNSFDLSL